MDEESQTIEDKLFLLAAIEKAIAHNQKLSLRLAESVPEEERDMNYNTKDNYQEASETSNRHIFQASTLDKTTKIGEKQAIALERLESLDRYIRHLQIRNARQNTESHYENEEEMSAVNSNYTQYESKAARNHLKEMNRKIKESQKILERQDALMTQLSICQDQIEKEMKKVSGSHKKPDFVGADKISFRKLANMSFGTGGKGKRLAQMAVDQQVSREMSLSSMLEDEGIKSNATCSEIRALVKKQVETLKAEDLKLIGDDTTFVRMINFFAEYKKKHDEWRKKQDRKDKNKLIAQMVNEERDKDEVSRREMNLHKIKLKPFYQGELSEEDQDAAERIEQERLKRQASLRESSISNRLSKDANIIRDRSVRGNDRY